MPLPTDNDPGASTFSGQVAGAVNGILAALGGVKQQVVSSGFGVGTYSPPSKASGPALFPGKAADDAGAVGQATAAKSLAAYNAARIKQLSSALATINKQIPTAKASLPSLQAKFTLYSGELRQVGGTPPAEAKPKTTATKLPGAISTPVSTASTGSTALGGSSATTGGGAAASGTSPTGLTQTAEIAILAGAVFLFFVLIARRKKR